MTSLLDLEAIKREHSLPAVVGGMTELKRAGHEWKACCPLHREKTPSFTIYDEGERWYCFGCGKGGDVLDFVREANNVGLRDAAAMLAGGDMPRLAVEPLPVREGGESRLSEARAIWRSSVPAKGTLAETYLRHRGIDIEIPPTIRFACLPYGKQGSELPVLVAAIAGPDDRLSGVQRTYLASDGRGKADVPKPKLSLGRLSGGAIRLTPAATSLVVCEGLEDALTLLQELGVSVWCAAGSSNMPKMQFPPLVRQVAIGADGDAAGRAAANKAGAEFCGRGLSVRTFFPTGPFKDFNAEIQGVRA